jgi:DNA polymerase-3 subunit epsilon
VPRRPTTFVAVDFETADPLRDSACALAMVRVSGRRIVARQTVLLRPPRPDFWFTHIHGITWEDVEDEPTFEEAWPALAPFLDGADFIAAHNAPFDRSVLAACCDRAGYEVPDLPFLCTVTRARRVWSLRPARLPDVCDYLGLPLRHHEAGSDAEACARIVLAALRDEGESCLGTLASRHRLPLPGAPAVPAAALSPRAPRASRRSPRRCSPPATRRRR